MMLEASTKDHSHSRRDVPNRPRRLRSSVYILFLLFAVATFASLALENTSISISLKDARWYGFNTEATGGADGTNFDESNGDETMSAIDDPALLVKNVSRNRSVSSTVALYICNDLHRSMQIHKIQELHSVFRDKLFVVTDQMDINASYPALPFEQIIGPDRQDVTHGRGNYTNPKVCCGTERSMMWLIDHQNRYEYAWIIEDDVYWANLNDLVDLFQLYDSDKTDLIDQHWAELPPFSGERKPKPWPHYKYLSTPYVHKDAAFQYPYYKAMFNLYRVSRRTVAVMDDWRVRLNEGEWTFFEGLLATLVMQHDDLTRVSFRSNAAGIPIEMKYRPCLTEFDVYEKFGGRGVFHPVKKDFVFCGDPLLWKKNKRTRAKLDTHSQ